ncbi:Chondroitin N-acetylgalactosaminyltransferase [Seminavis robusta]|uniref:Chondroitin N-acetylgalactosaminyltransferase n=1 Tax=Seminavis robusta TaxID=568900 RepID=A0A9N8EKN8_9STRA|nr:Chondroitin N-acetylgalactosaminyltransferase [Seminavis robusta]|eukprot:Sro1268_g257750.1 Chondroitin N-acetylgalactosaminyltransferase (413) ;mRNA; r:6496-7734
MTLRYRDSLEAAATYLWNDNLQAEEEEETVVADGVVTQHRSLLDKPMTSSFSSIHEFQLDVLVPAFQRDDRLRVFAAKLGQAIQSYRYNHQQKDHATMNTGHTLVITKFRLLVTRFAPERPSSELQQELASLSGLPVDQVVLVSSEEPFTRARAANLLHDNACRRDACLVARMDVDMQVRANFFQTALDIVVAGKRPDAPLQNNGPHPHPPSCAPDDPVIYFPVIWSAFNPESIQLIEQEQQQKQRRAQTNSSTPLEDPDLQLDQNGHLSEFSTHAGHWRPGGVGMHVMLGSTLNKTFPPRSHPNNDDDAVEMTEDSAMTRIVLRHDNHVQGWGTEDMLFYETATQAANLCVIRQLEPNLIHTWHPKQCRWGIDVKASRAKLVHCYKVRTGEEGSEYGRMLLKLANPTRRGP